jgi:hypothetical protein
MHRVETEKAYGSLDLPTKDVTFLWSDGDRKLTIHPDDGLEYGTLPAAVPDPRTYAYIIANEARDVAGNRLEEDFTASFTTLREYATMLSFNGATLITRSALGEDGYQDACGDGNTTAIIGEYVSPPETGSVRWGRGLLLSFGMLAENRPATPEDVLAAELSFESGFETAALGPLLVEQVRDDPTIATWDSPVFESLMLTRRGITTVADIRLALIESQFEHHDENVQFFIHYELMISDDETTHSSPIICGRSRIDVTFLAP